MRATYAFSTTDYQYEILGFEYAIQRLEDKFCKKQFGETIQLKDVTLEGVLAWTRGDGKTAVEKILQQPTKKHYNYDWAKEQIFKTLILPKYGNNEVVFRQLVISLAQRIERAEKKYGKENVPLIIYGNSD